MDIYMGARRNFSRGGGKPVGGANLWGGPQKSVKGGGPYFFTQALKYAYQGEG